ncbi:gamma-glutamylcyclotransferase family protein [Thaumasiovibrio subtropicus]|uniref:gamma-glutamylcyclotransferase family protein n=1 Tax=Thaumasiovibrio subtropicus TaxID=1891207 RepID=UPI000B352CC3|nr:gamma-glutamylcyclotransferase family protein [Thaumasiovibrio subtropicus]
MTDLVFVYGTLRQGEVNHFWLDGAAFIGKGTLSCGWALLDLGPYPAVMADASITQPLVGEVYRINDAILAKLDELEEYPTLYGREIVETQYGPAWLYYYQHIDEDQKRVIRSGDWCERA